MRFFYVAIKSLREIIRDRKGMAMLLAFPAIFMLVFGFAFSGGQGENNPYQIGVVNKDQGDVIDFAGREEEKQYFGNELQETLEGLTFEGSEVPLFETRKVSYQEGRDLLQDRDISALLTIPENFSRSVNQLIKATARNEVTSQIGETLISEAADSEGSSESPSRSDFVPSNIEDFPVEEEQQELPTIEEISTNLTITGDPSYIAYGRTKGILTGVLDGFLEEITTRVREEVASDFEGESFLVSEFVRVSSESISGTDTLSIFDYQAPGILVFAVLMAAVGVATTLAGEVEQGTLERLKLTNMNAFDLLFGTLLPWSFVAVAQVFILFATALLIGFTWAGGIKSLLVAVIVAAISGVTSVALGLLIAAFADNEDHASNLGTLITVPLSFVSGAFFPLPSMVIGSFFGYQFEIYDVLPWSHASNALRVLLSFGGGLSDVLVDIAFMLLLTTVLFFTGVFFFSRNRLSATN